MKAFAKIACLSFLAVCAFSHPAAAQTGAPASTNSAPRLTKRFTGKFLTLDAQAKTFTVDSATNDVVQVTSQTKIEKNRKPATFEDLAVGQTVTGSKHQNASGVWEASLVSVAVPKPPTTDPKVQ